MGNNNRNCNDDLFDAAIREAFRQRAREEEQEAAELIDRFQEEAAAVQPSKKFVGNMKYLSCHAGKRRTPTKIYPRFARIAAAIALVVGIGAAASAVAVQADWNSLLGWALQRTPVSTKLDKETSIIDFHKEQVFIDSDLDYFYFPSYLPENFEIKNIESDRAGISVELASTKNTKAVIGFDITPISDDISFSATFDTEDTRGFQKVMLGDRECFYVEKTYTDPETKDKILSVQIICNNEDCWIVYMSLNVPKKEAFKVMESIAKVEKNK